MIIDDATPVTAGGISGPRAYACPLCGKPVDLAKTSAGSELNHPAPLCDGFIEAVRAAKSSSELEQWLWIGSLDDDERKRLSDTWESGYESGYEDGGCNAADGFAPVPRTPNPFVKAVHS